MWYIALSGLLSFFALIASPASAQPVSGCAAVPMLLRTVSNIRGLTAKHPMGCEVHDQAQVRARITQLIAESSTAERLAFDEYLFKKLRLIPADFNYQQKLTELYTSQLGGYYDPALKRYVMAGWIPDSLQETVAVHELTHGLQDQHFDLKKLTDTKTLSFDETMARSALIEGDAMAVMIDHTQQLGGGVAVAKMESIEPSLLPNVLGASYTASATGVPEALQLALIFPYTSGLRFAHALLREGAGYSSLDRAFARMPTTTEEILHPELYLRVDGGVVLNDRRPISADEFSIPVADQLHSERFGEFGTSLVLAALTGSKVGVAEAARGWGGDRVVLGKSAIANSAEYPLEWITSWDSDGDADQFEQLLKPAALRLGAGAQLRRVDGRTVVLTLP